MIFVWGALIGCFLIFLMRFRINVLSLGDEEARSLGIKVGFTRWMVLICVTIVTASVVSVCGIVGWAGLVVPHFARMITGPDHRVLLPVTGLIGGLYLLIVDNMARAIKASLRPLFSF